MTANPRHLFSTLPGTQGIGHDCSLIGNFRKSLQATGFPHGKVTHVTIRVPEHVLAPAHTMIARFEGLRRFIQRTAGMACITARTGLQDMVGPGGMTRLPSWFTKVGNGIPNGSPRRAAKQFGKKRIGIGGAEKKRRRGPVFPRDTMALPVFTGMPLLVKQGVPGMRGAGNDQGI